MSERVRANTWMSVEDVAKFNAVIDAARAWYYADNSNGPVTDSGVVDIIGDLERAVRALDGGDQ